MKHVVVFSTNDIEKLLNGELEFDLRFFKKKPEFLSKLSVGDIVYFRKKGEILGQFEVGKIISVENLGIEDWKWVEGFAGGMDKDIFEVKISQNSILLITQITKVEQFITSPIDLDKKSRKEWVILD